MHERLRGGADRSVTILVVDDDDSLRALFRRALERQGFAVMEAGGGAEALDLVRHGTVDLLLVDSAMPDLDGPTVTRRLREDPLTQTLPVLLVTGRDGVEERVAGLEAGADDYLVKPVALDELVARVKAHLRLRDAWSVAIDELEHRAVLADILRATPNGLSLSDTVGALCRELGERGIAGAAIVALTGRAGRVLGATGELEAVFRGVGGDLARPVVDGLRRRSMRGPWVEDTRDLRPIEGPGIPTPLPFGVLAGAPVTASDQLLGVALLYEPATTWSADQSGRLLATAIDLSVAAGVVTSHELLVEEERGEARATLRGMVADEAFVPHFQPVVRLDDRGVVGFEALTRFHDGERPDVRFSTAHRLEIGAELERAAAQVAIREAARLPAGAWLSLNASPSVLEGDPEFWSVLAGCARPLVIEVTEHEPVRDYAALRGAIEASEPRVRLAVDDAGTGYATLSHILRLRPEFVKLDLEWVRAIDADPVRQALVAGLHHFAEVAGCALVAEGIETEEECATLRELGVDFGQGYFLGRPTPIADLASAS